MSWNFQTQLNNLKIQVAQLSAGSVTNPLTSALNCSSYPINNATNLSALSGQNLNLNASVGNSVIVNAPLSIPNHPLVITNNTTSDSIIISDSNPDTSTFRIDASGNVGIKSNPSVPLTTDLTVNGSTLMTGDLSANNITCASLTAPSIIASNVVNNIIATTPGLLKTGTSTNPILTNTGVTSAVAGTGIGVSAGTGAVTINNTGVTSLVAGSNISLSGATGAVTITATSGPSTWVGTATSALNMSNYQIDNLGAPNSATDVPQVNTVQSSVLRFSAGTNLWIIGANTSFPISSVFATAPNTLFIFGSIYNGTVYQGGTSNILPPSRFVINFRCPVSTSSTSFSPGTNWPTGTPYYIRCELLNYNFATSTVLNWLDTQTVTGWVNNTGPSGSPANVPYLTFSVTLCSNQSCPVDIAGNGRAIALNISLANASAGGSYSFNPSGSNAGIGSLPYQDCAGIECSVTTLAGSSGQGF